MCDYDTTKYAGYCGAPTHEPCKKLVPIGKAHRVNGVLLCRADYQYIWEQSKKHGITIEEAFKFLIGRVVKRPLTEYKEKVCARVNCNNHLPAGKYRGRIGEHELCHSCIQAISNYRLSRNISMEEAFLQIGPKGQTQKKNVPVECRCCKKYHKPIEKNYIDGLGYFCSTCRVLLNKLAKFRKMQPQTWTYWAKEVLLGRAKLPNDETCVMFWCKCNISERYKYASPSRRKPRRGPNGEPICSADDEYLRRYAKVNNITFAQAFATAPPPLIRAKGRGKPRKRRKVKISVNVF